MPRTTPDQWLQKHEQNTQNALPFVRDGINRVQVAPGQAAAEAQDRMLAGVQQAVSSGRWARNVSAVSLQDWKTLAIEKGVNRIVPGIQASRAKNRPKIERLMNVEARIEGEIKAMPRDTLENRINRSTEWMRRMNRAKMSGEI